LARPLQFQGLPQGRKKENDDMKTTTKAGLKIKANVKAGGFGGGNHSRSGLKVRSLVKAGGFGGGNYNRSGLKVRSLVKAGGFGGGNHSRAGLRVKSALKAGSGMPRANHSVRCFAIS
jgi:hypothetical protein